MYSYSYKIFYIRVLKAQDRTREVGTLFKFTTSRPALRGCVGRILIRPGGLNAKTKENGAHVSASAGFGQVIRVLFEQQPEGL